MSCDGGLSDVHSSGEAAASKDLEVALPQVDGLEAPLMVLER